MLLVALWNNHFPLRQFQEPWQTSAMSFPMAKAASTIRELLSWLLFYVSYVASRPHLAVWSEHYHLHISFMEDIRFGQLGSKKHRPGSIPKAISATWYRRSLCSCPRKPQYSLNVAFPFPVSFIIAVLHKLVALRCHRIAVRYFQSASAAAF